MRRARSAEVAASALAVWIFTLVVPVQAAAQIAAFPGSDAAARSEAQERAPAQSPRPLIPPIVRDRMAQHYANWAPRAERLLLAARDSLPTPLRQRVPAWTAWSESARGRQDALALIAGLLALLVAVRLLRGRGDLAVSIEYPAELRGTFSVRLARKKGRFKRTPRGSRLEAQKLRASSPNEHYLVSRETQFRGLSARRWFITVEGVLQDLETHAVLADHFDE